MKKIIYFFYPKIKVTYFEKLKTLFFIKLSFFLVALLSFFLDFDFWFKNENILISVYSESFSIALLISCLFLLRKKGIRLTGNTFSILVVGILLIFLNIIHTEIDPFYKYVNGFYSVLAYLAIGLLFATGTIILINSVLTLLTTTDTMIESNVELTKAKEKSQADYIDIIQKS